MHQNDESQVQKSPFYGFSKLTAQEKEQRLLDLKIISHDDLQVLKQQGALPYELASAFIENCLGYFPMPLGIAVNFLIDNHEYCIPMVVEETSVIASCSKIASWVRSDGSITTENCGNTSIGQIQFAQVNSYEKLHEVIYNHKEALIKAANENRMASMYARGGGVKDLSIRAIHRPDGTLMAVVHVHIDTCDAMGANIINQVCEYLRKPIESLSGETVSMCILSNLVDQKLTQAHVVIKNINKELGKQIEEASLFAQLDPYRAATNNKGIMNGIDAVLLATGNDWRAVEAGAHAFAARSGQYTSLTHWVMKAGDLHGTLAIPLALGIVGGVTRLHPVAKVCLKMLGVENAAELARVVAAVGIIQNLAALKALVSEGIVKGHMRLHITNLAIAAGASNDELPLVKAHLEKSFLQQNSVSEQDAVLALMAVRGNSL